MSRADEVLNAIDHALHDFETSEDAMRWTPEPPPEPRPAAAPPIYMHADLIIIDDPLRPHPGPFAERIARIFDDIRQPPPRQSSEIAEHLLISFGLQLPTLPPLHVDHPRRLVLAGDPTPSGFFNPFAGESRHVWWEGGAAARLDRPRAQPRHPVPPEILARWRYREDFAARLIRPSDLRIFGSIT